MAELFPRYHQESMGYSLPVLAATKIERGHAIGCDSSTGYMRPLVSGDDFAGLCATTADNISGASGDINVSTRRGALVELDVVGSSITSWGAVVYATASNVYNVAGTSEVGVIEKWLSGTTCLVKLK